VTQAGAAGRPSPPVDWGEWDQALRSFSGATGLCVSAYDSGSVRRIGPLPASGVGAFLFASGAWEADGSASAVELALVEECMRTQRPVERSLDEAITLQAQPFGAIGEPGDVWGVIVIGWVFTQFASSLGCQRIARELNLGAPGLWAAARRESPTPAARVGVSGRLLQTLIDSTARHAKALETVHDLARIREIFLAHVSHELRAPLGALALRIELLLRNGMDDPVKARDSLLQMKRHVVEQARLIEDVIDAARTRTGQFSVERRPLELARVIEAAVAAVRPAAEAKGVLLAAPDPHALDGCRVMGDAQRLQQVFWNVLSNAVKFTPPQGRVSVTARAAERTCQVTVTDTGRGIDAATLSLVFEPFARQRLDNAQGLGLGLSIARQIIDLHHGTISVRSDGPDRGATFQIELPRL
jgi:signal transduction histidine kinase